MERTGTADNRNLSTSHVQTAGKERENIGGGRAGESESGRIGTIRVLQIVRA